MIKVKLFGLLRLDSGIKQLELEARELNELCTKVAFEIKKAKPDSAINVDSVKNCIVAVNGKQVKPGAKLTDGDEVMFLSPVAGG